MITYRINIDLYGLIAHVTAGYLAWGAGAHVRKVKKGRWKDRYLFSIYANEFGGPGPNRYFREARDAVWEFIKYTRGNAIITITESPEG